jgi:radical SAM superfamily enzyme YgiQ (UPF0313 family)
VSTSNFVPKAHTPFQWRAEDTVEELRRKQQLLKGALKMRCVDYSWHDAGISALEAAFARGGRPMSKVLFRAWELGARFDGWREHFKLARWQQAFEDTGVDIVFWANRQIGRDEILPWEHLSSGVKKEFLWAENVRAEAAVTTPDCRGGCLGCGLMDACGGRV